MKKRILGVVLASSVLLAGCAQVPTDNQQEEQKETQIVTSQSSQTSESLIGNTTREKIAKKSPVIFVVGSEIVSGDNSIERASDLKILADKRSEIFGKYDQFINEMSKEGYELQDVDVVSDSAIEKFGYGSRTTAILTSYHFTFKLKDAKETKSQQEN